MPKFTKDLFQSDKKNYYDLRHYRDFRKPFIDLVYHGSKSISYLNLKTESL